MTKIRRLLVPVAAALMFLALGATGAKAQAMYSTEFAGTFTLPFMAVWGDMYLPPGEYDLYYGKADTAGTAVVEIRSDGIRPEGVIIAKGRSDVKASNNALVCVLEGDKGFVRTLELPEIGESASFARPLGVSVESWIRATAKMSRNANTQLAETRIPIKPAK